MTPRMFLADPSLIGHSGHCFGYLAALAPVARARGYEPIYLGNHAVCEQLRTQHNVLPAFTHWCDARYGTPERTRRLHESDLTRELLELTRRFEMTANDVVFINTLRHWALRGVVDWLESLNDAQCPRVALVLHFTAFPNPARSDGTCEFYRQAFARIARSPARERIRLLADSETLIEEYRAMAPQLDFALAPIPHVYHTTTDTRRNGFNVGYVGEARENKGFHLLPRLVRKAAEADVRGVQFHIHAFAHNRDSEFLQRTLAGLRHHTVTLHSDEMPGNEYREFVASLDMVALPYTIENYHAQTSGVFAEAMGNGSVVIAPKGTWMARQLHRFGGGAAFNPGDAEDFANVTLETIAKFQSADEDRSERVRKWREFHNPERLLKLVCE